MFLRRKQKLFQCPLKHPLSGALVTNHLYNMRPLKSPQKVNLDYLSSYCFILICLIDSMEVRYEEPGVGKFHYTILLMPEEIIKLAGESMKNNSTFSSSFPSGKIQP